MTRQGLISKYVLFPFTLRITLYTSLLCPLSFASLYVFTEPGELARSIDEGETWIWIAAVLPISNCVDITSDPGHRIHVLSKTGEMYCSADQGISWQHRGNIPVSDACALWVITGNTFVVTERGDFYQRYADGTWSLLGNLGACDCVDLVPKPSAGWLVLTQKGDCWDVTTTPFSSTLVGNIGSSTVVAATSLTMSVIAASEEGDIARSVSNGTDWSWYGTLSQLSIVALANETNVLYAITDCGEVARSTNQGSTWSWRGSVNQMGVKGITSDTLTLIGVEEAEEITALRISSVCPNPSTGYFTVTLHSRGSGDGRIRLFDISGRDTGVHWCGRILSGDNYVSLQQQNTGVYFIMIESKNTNASEKIIVR